MLVPEDLKQSPHLLLNLSYRFDPPDLAVSEWGVRSTLTFSGTRFTVAVPWSALYAISADRSQIELNRPVNLVIYPKTLNIKPLARSRAARKHVLVRLSMFFKTLKL